MSVRVTEGQTSADIVRGRPSTIGYADGPPPPVGEEFMGAAARLAGMAGAVLGWSPDTFWRATPAELGTVVRAIVGEIAVPPDGDTLAQLREAFPDG